jgi:hypothetical protein
MIFLYFDMIIKTRAENAIISALVDAVHFNEAVAAEAVLRDDKNAVLPDVMNIIEDYIGVRREHFDASNAALDLAALYLCLVEPVNADADAFNVRDTATQNDLLAILAGCVDATEVAIVNFAILDKHFTAREI